MIICKSRKILYCNLMVFSGGYPYPHQLIEYDITRNVFVDYGENNLSQTVGFNFGLSSTYFSQINDTTLYTIARNGVSINLFDLQTLSFTNLSTAIPATSSVYGCISSSETPNAALYITGGYLYTDASRQLQVFSLENSQWLTNPPSLSHYRTWHACIVAREKLWAIGGWDTDSIEYVTIMNIEAERWQIAGYLNQAIYTASVTAVDNTIFVIGGAFTNDNGQTTHSLNTVYTIDTVMNTINIAADELPIYVSVMAVIAVDHTIYGFAGWKAPSETAPAPFSASWVSLDVYVESVFVLYIEFGQDMCFSTVRRKCPL